MSALNLSSSRARRARLGKKLGPKSPSMLYGLAGVLALAGIALLATGSHIGLSLFGLGVLLYSFGAWITGYLIKVEPAGNSLNGRLDAAVLAVLRLDKKLTPQSVWQALSGHWQVRFFTNHLLLPVDFIDTHLSDKEADMATVWEQAARYADQTQCPTIEPGHVAAALLHGSPAVHDLLTTLKHSPDDLIAILEWLGRDLANMRRPRQNFGGIGRDWATGFTPRLNQFGINISRSIEKHGAHFATLVDSPGVHAMRQAFSQGAGALALVGQEGVGKTSHAYALAQTLLAESQDHNLEHRQVISLSPSHIISAAERPGDLEFIVTMLLNEAAHAGNIILFFDDAQLFFQNGPGSFNATQILLPAIQSRRVQCIFAMTPQDYQRLKGDNPAFANLLTPVVLQEPPEQEILVSLTAAATQFEIHHKTLIAYEAILETYRLSGRYDQDLVYPGRAIRLLEQSLTHASGGVVNAASVQAAIEQTVGVKVGDTSVAEADQLLNLEDEIHTRMINQSHAVSVVANALRRARAGVGNPNRPIGSFLFLGPTGVGKTELAKSVAATYFGNEAAMIRLDMSEYQQDSDVARLLSAGEHETSSLILRVRQQPFSVVLLDEIEKAHPNILNLLLQLLDEGQLTDAAGRSVSFKDAVVIATSNAGADTIRSRIEAGESLESFESAFSDELISSGQFKPELINRFDEIVLFRPLNPDELAQVVRLMLTEVNQTLSNQNISVGLTDAAIAKIVEVGNDPRLGARPMRRALQRAVEDVVAGKILRGDAKPGDRLTLDVTDLAL